MNRLPQKKKRGDPILAEDWNTLLDAIAARTPRSGTGLELIASSGGFAYSQANSSLIPRQSLPAFSVIGIEKEDGNYKVIIKEGWVIERKPKVASDVPCVKFHIPKSGGDPLDTIPRPKIEMTLGDTLWCKYQTNIQGEISEEPEVIVSAEDQDGTHFQPEDPEESGEEGTYFVKLFKLEDDDGTPKVKVYQQSDIEHWAQLWTGENVGGGASVYKQHASDENIYKFRSIRGDYGIKEKETSDEVELDFWGENVGEGCPVWVEPEEDGETTEDPPDGPTQFRTVDGRESGDGSGATRQIYVRCEPAESGDPLPETIRVVGNSKVGALIFLDCEETETARLEWDDGLIINEEDISVTLGDCGGRRRGGGA